jgi:polyhydroxyalkanoate synthesis regulator phasin
MSIKTKMIKLAKMLVKFEDIPTDKGVLTVDGDLEVGKEVFTTDENGNIVVAENGEYIYDNKTITIEGGIITNIKDNGVEQTETEAETVVEEMTEETPEETPTETVVEEVTETVEEVTPETETISKEEEITILNETIKALEAKIAELEAEIEKAKQPQAPTVEEAFNAQTIKEETINQIDFTKYINNKRK